MVDAVVVYGCVKLEGAWVYGCGVLGDEELVI